MLLLLLLSSPTWASLHHQSTQDLAPGPNGLQPARPQKTGRQYHQGHLAWPSYPPPLPLWALGPISPYKTRRRFIPYFGPSWRPPTTTTTTTTTMRPFVPFSTCSHLPPYCMDYFSSTLSSPLPTQCIDVCAVDDVQALQPTLSACSVYPSANLPTQCIDIIQAILRRQRPKLSYKQLKGQKRREKNKIKLETRNEGLEHKGYTKGKRPNGLK